MTSGPVVGSPAWNEEMVRRYDIEHYYASAPRLIRWIESRRLQQLVRLAAVQPTERLLEVGCGSGRVLERFVQARAIGVDLSATMLARTRERVDWARVAQAAGEALPFRDGGFDVVICTEVLEHVPDPAAVLRELVRVTGEGGRVVVSVPNEGLIDLAKRIIGALPRGRRVLRTLAAPGNEWHLHAFDRAMLRRVCDSVARIERIHPVPAPGLPLRYAALLRPLARSV